MAIKFIPTMDSNGIFSKRVWIHSKYLPENFVKETFTKLDFIDFFTVKKTAAFDFVYKQCKDCKVIFSVNEFSNNQCICNCCKKIKNRLHQRKARKEHPEYFLEANRKYNKKHHEKVNKKKQEYFEKNRDKFLEYHKNYREINKDKIRETIRIRDRQRRKEDIHYYLKKTISRSIGYYLKLNNSRKNGGSTLKSLPYTMEELKQHLEKQFEPWMNWENRGIFSKNWDDNDSSTWAWSIDHIVPQAELPYTTMNEENFFKCWALENLRPLNAKQNYMDGLKTRRGLPR